MPRSNGRRTRRLALKEGATAEAVEVVRQRGSTAGLPPQEALVVDAVRTLFADHALTDDQYDQVTAAYRCRA